MQQEHCQSQPIRPTRLVRFSNSSQQKNQTAEHRDHDSGTDIAMQPTQNIEVLGNPSLQTTPAYSFDRIDTPEQEPPKYFNEIDTPEQEPPDISLEHTNIMHLSGMMRAIRMPQRTVSQPIESSNSTLVEEYWPNGIQQTGPLPIVNLYGGEPFGRTLSQFPVTPAKAQPKWKAMLNAPATKITLGLLVGIGLLYLVSRFVDIPTTLQVLRQNLTTPRGIILALLSGVAFLVAFCVRGMRWKLFLNPIGKVSTLKAIQLFLVGIFLNFLLPVRGGEVAKSIMLKRIANIPVSKSLPTVAMDKALDLMPALFIMAIVPFLGIKMDIKLWLILGSVGGLLIGLIFFVALAAWKRSLAITLLGKIIGVLPRAIGSKIEGFATGFVDSLLMGASRPKIFIPAVLLTCVAVIFDGLFAMLAFWTIGFPIPFGTAIFGYTVYNMFYILPTPPGQVGSNEFAGLLVFAGLLGLPAEKVTAMFVFSHPWAALLMTVTGMACLSALGLTISSAMKVQAQGEKAATLPQQTQDQQNEKSMGIYTYK